MFTQRDGLSSTHRERLSEPKVQQRLKRLEHTLNLELEVCVVTVKLTHTHIFL